MRVPSMICERYDRTNIRSNNIRNKRSLPVSLRTYLAESNRFWDFVWICYFGGLAVLCLLLCSKDVRVRA